MAELTKADFPHGQLHIDPAGLIVRKEASGPTSSKISQVIHQQ